MSLPSVNSVALNDAGMSTQTIPDDACARLRATYRMHNHSKFPAFCSRVQRFYQDVDHGAEGCCSSMSDAHLDDDISNASSPASPLPGNRAHNSYRAARGHAHPNPNASPFGSGSHQTNSSPHPLTAGFLSPGFHAGNGSSQAGIVLKHRTRSLSPPARVPRTMEEEEEDSGSFGGAGVSSWAEEFEKNEVHENLNGRAGLDANGSGKRIGDLFQGRRSSERSHAGRNEQQQQHDQLPAQSEHLEDLLKAVREMSVGMAEMREEMGQMKLAMDHGSDGIQGPVPSRSTLVHHAHEPGHDAASTSSQT